MPLVQKNPLAFGIFNGLTPLKGPKAIALELDFSTDTAIEVDLSQQAKDGTIDFIQSAWIDNAVNGAAVTLLVPATKQQIVVPLNSQGSYPLIITSELKFRVSTFAFAGRIVTIILTNTQLDPR